MYFVMTVDVEADDAWNSPDKIQLKNLSQIPRFQKLCDKYGIVPTYLLSYECACRDEAVSVLKPVSDAGKCEIGHHLHCWTTPPFEKEGPPGVDSAWIHAYQFELPDSLFVEKAECLRLAIENAYGRSPTSHRAGRWGIDQRSINWLVENGFVAESSVVPHMSLSKNRGKSQAGPSYYLCPLTPYAWYSSNVFHKDKSFLMEMPLTVYFPHNLLFKICMTYLQYDLPLKSTIERFYGKIMRFGGMFRPDPRYSDSKLLKIIKSGIQDDLPILNFMIHSSELASGCSPFSMNKDDSDQVWKNLETVFNYIKLAGIPSGTLSEIAKSLSQNISQI